MPILEPKNSFATNDSDAIDLYFYRKSYKRNILTNDGEINKGIADLWYGRNLYGKIDREGNIVLPREKFLDTLWSLQGDTIYAINFVALMFNEMTDYIGKNIAGNKIPTRDTIYRKIGADKGWSSVYDSYHQYMISIFNIYADSLITQNISYKIKNFNDFMHNFYIFATTNIIKKDRPFTLSSFVASNLVSNRSSGLVIDLFDAQSDSDIEKVNTFINDINYDFILHAATKHGFVMDKNNPWKAIANLSSDVMNTIMRLSKFDVRYEVGSKNLFNRYYRKTSDFDMIFLRNYMYMFYNSLVQSNPAFEESFYCEKTNRFIKRMRSLAPLTDELRESLTVKDYWMEQYYRYRLSEVKHELNEEKIEQHIKKAKDIYRYKGEKRALDYLYTKIKKYFLGQYNEVDLCMMGAPMFFADFMKK